MSDKYLKRDSATGLITEVEGTVVGGTAGQDGAIVALDSTGRVSATILPVGVGADTHAANAGEALLAGDFCYVKADGLIWKAAATSGGAFADGFVLSSSSVGQPALLYFEGRNTALTGLTVGARYYLSDSTAGSVTAVPVSGAGKRHQFIGKAITSSTIAYEGDDGVILA